MMRKKECKIQTVYYIKTARGYLTSFGGLCSTLDSAACFTDFQSAMQLSEQVGGFVEPKIITKKVITLITKSFNCYQERSDAYCHVLYDLGKSYNISNPYATDETFNNGDGNKRERLITAISRYACIFHNANTLIDAYYDMTAMYDSIDYSFETESILFEGDNTMYDLFDDFEKQIERFALLYRDARDFLEEILLGLSVSGSIEKIIEKISHEIIENYIFDSEAYSLHIMKICNLKA